RGGGVEATHHRGTVYNPRRGDDLTHTMPLNFSWLVAVAHRGLPVRIVVPITRRILIRDQPPVGDLLPLSATAREIRGLVRPARPPRRPGWAAAARGGPPQEAAAGPPPHRPPPPPLRPTPPPLPCPHPQPTAHRHSRKRAAAGPLLHKSWHPFWARGRPVPGG